MGTISNGDCRDRFRHQSLVGRGGRGGRRRREQKGRGEEDEEGEGEEGGGGEETTHKKLKEDEADEDSECSMALRRSGIDGVVSVHSFLATARALVPLVTA